MSEAGLAIEPAGARLARPARRTSQIAFAYTLWLAVAANAGAIAWLWWHGGNVSRVHTTADVLDSIGRITGLLGAYLSLVQVLLLARLPALERLTGFDRLTVWHRRNGKLTLYLILAHVVFITIGYQLMDRISLWREISRLLSSYPGMITATIGTGFLIAVVATSLVLVRRRLRYEWWYCVHLLAYAGIALGWIHQVPTGNELTADPTAADYWLSLYAATLALLVLFRLVQPAVQAFRHRLRVAEIAVEGPGVVSLRITGRRLDRLDARAGQFFLWRFLTRGHWRESHPFSLSEAPDGRSLRITVKNVGDFTSRIGEIRPGTAVVTEGPFGVFTGAVRRLDHVALIAGGIGITPIRAMLEELPGDLVLVYRVVRDEDVVFRSELEELARGRGIALHIVVGDHAAPDGDRLLSAEHLRELVPDLAKREVYLCGPPAMMRAAEKAVRKVGVPRNLLHSERFAL